MFPEAGGLQVLLNAQVSTPGGTEGCLDNEEGRVVGAEGWKRVVRILGSSSAFFFLCSAGGHNPRKRAPKPPQVNHQGGARSPPDRAGNTPRNFCASYLFAAKHFRPLFIASYKNARRPIPGVWHAVRSEKNIVVLGASTPAPFFVLYKSKSNFVITSSLLP